MQNTLEREKIKSRLRALYDTALAPALPQVALRGFSLPSAAGKTVLLSVGKAASQMARAIDHTLPNDISGWIITRQGFGDPSYRPENLTLIEASHPVPDGRGEKAAQMVLSKLADLGADDLLLVLMSGGASALLPAPVAGLTMAQKKKITLALLRSGASISEMNIVRKHLSAVKGGKLAAAAYPARTMMVGISDIPGDDMTLIGSGPTVADPSTCDDALAIIKGYDLPVPQNILDKLMSGELETPKPGDVSMSRASAKLCARPLDMCEAAVEEARSMGYEPIMLGDALERDAVELGRQHAQMAMALKRQGRKAALISGGEATVTIKNNLGRGGRCSAYVLACALELKGAPGIIGFAADSDGIDGSEDNAGAFLWPGILDEMGGKDAAQFYLDRDDSYGAFEDADGLLVTGPSGTNINDLRVLLIN